MTRPDGSSRDARAKGKPRSGTLDRSRRGTRIWLIPAGFQPARQSSGRAMDLALQEGESEAAASYQAARAVWEAVFGNVAEAKRTPWRRSSFPKAGTSNTSSAWRWHFRESLLDRNRSPTIWKNGSRKTRSSNSHTSRFFARSPHSRGQARRQRRAAASHAPLRGGRQRPQFQSLHLGGMHSAYVRGEALLALHRYAEAAAEFQKILDHRGIVGADPIGALAHVQLGRAFVLSGDTIKAKAAYQDFLTLWKDADADIPILAQAKAEFAKLQ